MLHSDGRLRGSGGESVDAAVAADSVVQKDDAGELQSSERSDAVGEDSGADGADGSAEAACTADVGAGAGGRGGAAKRRAFELRPPSALHVQKKGPARVQPMARRGWAVRACVLSCPVATEVLRCRSPSNSHTGRPQATPATCHHPSLCALPAVARPRKQPSLVTERVRRRPTAGLPRRASPLVQSIAAIRRHTPQNEKR